MKDQIDNVTKSELAGRPVQQNASLTCLLDSQIKLCVDLAPCAIAQSVLLKTENEQERLQFHKT